MKVRLVYASGRIVDDPEMTKRFGVSLPDRLHYCDPSARFTRVGIADGVAIYREDRPPQPVVRAAEGIEIWLL